MSSGPWTRRCFPPDVAQPARRGFTIVEILVSLVLLTTGLLGLSAVTRTAGRALAMERAYARAAASAEDLMETALASGFPEDPGEAAGDWAALTWSARSSGVLEALVVVRGRVGESEVVDSLVRLVGR